MPKPLTDRKILTAIYKRYYDRYAAFNEEDRQRSAKIWVPIDINDLSARLGMEVDILFGRLYYHLNNRYGYEVEGPRTGKDNTKSKMRVDLFALRVGADHHCIHFPLLASVLATLQDENRKYLLATTLSIIALALSLFSFFIKIVRGTGP